MSFRIEQKLKIAKGKIFQLKSWISKNKGIRLHPNRIINSIYFDNENYSMYNQSLDGTLPRKKIRLRIYEKDFTYDKNISKEIKSSSVEGKYKITELAKNPLKLIDLGIYDNNYGLCHPVLNVLYERSYYKIQDVRITVDERIIYKKVTNRKISKIYTSDDFDIVELKSNFPKSINQVNNNFPFEKVRFSKYCRGIEFTRLNYCNEL